MNLGERIGLALGIPAGVILTMFVAVPFLNSLPLDKQQLTTNCIIGVCLAIVVLLLVTKKRG